MLSPLHHLSAHKLRYLMVGGGTTVGSDGTPHRYGYLYPFRSTAMGPALGP